MPSTPNRVRPLASTALVIPDAAVFRTYNSQGLLDDDNGDNWRIGFYRRVHSLTGTANTAGSTVRRTDADGASALYTYDAALGKYVTGEGEGAYDTLAYNAATQVWTWTDGATGLTAYVGLTDVGQITEGETVVVSAAAGATGSIAVQIAKILGCRVIGIAGTDEKCAWLVDDLGIDGAINHRTDDIPAKLRELCPKRVDVFFDNTGGPILDHVLGRLADHARVVLCGAISSYNDHHKPPGPPNYLNLISRRARMEGFISWDSWGRWAEITDILGGWVADGRLRHRSHVFEGLESGPHALNAMFTGENIGKVVIRVGG